METRIIHDPPAPTSTSGDGAAPRRTAWPTFGPGQVAPPIGPLGLVCFAAAVVLLTRGAAAPRG